MTLMLFVRYEDLWQHPSHDHLQKIEWVIMTLMLLVYYGELWPCKGNKLCTNVENVCNECVSLDFFCNYVKQVGNIGQKNVLS
jgi:hypothetical protein